jgi:hypothetical protein
MFSICTLVAGSSEKATYEICRSHDGQVYSKPDGKLYGHNLLKPNADARAAIEVGGSCSGFCGGTSEGERERERGRDAANQKEKLKVL